MIHVRRSLQKIFKFFYGKIFYFANNLINKNITIRSVNNPKIKKIDNGLYNVFIE